MNTCNICMSCVQSWARLNSLPSKYCIIQFSTVSVYKALHYVLSYCTGLALIMLLLYLMGRKYVSLLFSSFVLESELCCVYMYSN